MLAALMLLVFLACVGFLYAEGMWSNAVRLVNVVTAALIAMSYFEPLARWLEGMIPSYTYFIDMIAVWGLFAACMMLLRVLTDTISHVRVRFLKIADRIGGVVFACLIGWVMVCFATATLHMAPLGHKAFSGGFDPGNDAMFFGMAGPDRQWLNFTHRVTAGCFSRKEGPEFAASDTFIRRYENRRDALEEQRTKKKAFLVDKGTVQER